MAFPERKGRWKGEIWNRRKNGEIYPQRGSISAARIAFRKSARWCWKEARMDPAQRLSDAVPKNGLLCRWGADEFVLLLDQVGDRDSIAVIVQALFNSLARPLRLKGHELIPSACVGISFYPEDAANAQGLIQAAETALYRAKERGPANIELFTPLLAERLHRKFEVASELRRAIQNNELMLRWQHPTKGLISPVDFIPLAEELGLIELLGDCVLKLVPGFAKKIHQLLCFKRTAITFNKLLHFITHQRLHFRNLICIVSHHVA